MRWAVLVFVVAACGDGKSSSELGTLDASTEDAANESTADAGTEMPLVVYGCDPSSPITSLALPDVPLGQSATYWMRLAGNPSSAQVAASSGGPDLSTGYSLFDGLGVTFTPSALGPQTFTLDITASTPHGLSSAQHWRGTLTVTGTGIEPTTGPLAVNTVMNNGSSPVITLSNTSASTAIDLLTSSLDTYGYGGYQPANTGTLQPGETQLVRLNAPPGRLGCQRTKVTVNSSANSLDLYVDSFGGYPLGASLNGVVTATPPCPDNVCNAPTQLSALPNSGAHFVGWMIDSGCTQEATCEPHGGTAFVGFIPTPPPPNARFALDTAPVITFTRQGTHDGWILFYEEDGRAVVCTSGCSYSPSNSTTKVFAIAGAATFTGWSGACSGTARVCNLGIPAGPITLSASFANLDRELTTLRPHGFQPGDIAAAAYLPSGDLIIGGNALARLTAAGTVVWRKPVLATDLVVNVAGEIFASTFRGEPVIERRDAKGDLVWSRALHQPYPWYGSARVALTPSGNVAVVDASSVRVLAASDGAIVWSAPIPTYPNLSRVATDSAGRVIVGYEGADGQTHVRRFDAGGTRLDPEWTLPGSIAAIATTANDHVIVRTLTTDGEAYLARYRTNGSLVYSLIETGFAPIALTVAANGDVVLVDRNVSTEYAYRVQRRGANGSATWEVTLPIYTNASIAGGPIGTWASALAPDPTGGFSVVGFEGVLGQYTSHASWPWLRRFSP